MLNILRIVFVVLVATQLFACKEKDSAPPETRPSGTLTGRNFDAPVRNATVEAYSFAGGTMGALLGTTKTDANGDYTLSINSPDSEILVRAGGEGAFYEEEESTVRVNLNAEQWLEAVLFYESGKTIDVQLTDATHMAACYAKYKLTQGSTVGNAIVEANVAFSALTDVDILNVKPLEITDINNLSNTLTDPLKYGFHAAANSFVTAQLSADNQLAAHSTSFLSTIHYSMIRCNDVESDGVLDGLGTIAGVSGQQLAIGTVPLNTPIYRTVHAQKMLAAALSAVNKVGITVDQLLATANSYALSTHPVWDQSSIPEKVDSTGPIITATIPALSQVKGMVEFGFNVIDDLGVKSVEVDIDGEGYVFVQVDTSIYNLLTTNYADGDHVLSVRAFDTIDNVTITSFTYSFVNTAPTVAFTSDTLTNQTAYTAMGTYQEEGSPVDTITVNGENATINTVDSTWSIDLTLVSGFNNLDVVITDNVGNTNNSTLMVGVDLVFPTIDPVNSIVRFTTFEGLFNRCTPGTLTLSSSVDNPICIRTDRVSLDGAEITSDISNEPLGLTAINFVVGDPVGAGVFSDASNLLAEYRYTLNNDNDVVVDWTAVPTPPNNGSFYVLPITTEYMGLEWFITTPDIVHTVSVRLTDKAGNSKKLDWKLQFDPIAPLVEMTTSLPDDPTLANATFGGRHAIDAMNYRVEYSYINNTNSSYYMIFNEAVQHSVVHTYETVKRRNRARIGTQEKWQLKFGTWVVGSSNPVIIEFGDWEPVTSLIFERGDTYNKPDPTFTPFNEYNGDNDTITLADDTPWISLSTGGGLPPFDNNICPGDWVTEAVVAANNTSFRHRRFASNLQIIVNLKPIDGRDLYACIGNRYHFQTQLHEFLDNAPGFPKNEITSTPSITTVFNTTKIDVIDETNGKFVAPLNSKYLIPSNSTIRIIKSITLPGLEHHNDNEVADLSSFSSYVEKSLDKTTTWDISTDLGVSIEVAIAGSGTTTPNLSAQGLGSKQYTITR